MQIAIAQHFWLVLSLTVVGGLVLGSFLNVLITRVPQRTIQQFRKFSLQSLHINPNSVDVPSLVHPLFSRCPRCRIKISARYLIPLVSWLVLRGRCAECHERIPMRYPVVEVLGVLIIAVAITLAGLTVHAAALVVCFSLLVCLAVSDLEEGVLPDELTVPLLWTGLLFVAFTDSSDLLPSLPSAVIGAAAGYLCLSLINSLYRTIRGRDGMGSGDFKLLAALGAWIGWQLLPVVALAATTFGVIYGVALLIQGRYSYSTGIPFGPFLALAGVTVILFRTEFIALVFA